MFENLATIVELVIVHVADFGQPFCWWGCPRRHPLLWQRCGMWGINQRPNLGLGRIKVAFAL